MKHIFSLLVFTFLLSGLAYAQYYETGQDPASIRWRQINTVNFQLIYPEDFEAQAQRVAFIFEKVYEYAAENLQQRPRKISVVFHTHTVESNGLVAWAPKRVEFFTTPNQQIYSQDWLEQLAIHEFTHVMQMDRVQEELPRILPLLLGEQAAAVVVGAYLPFWLLEGDAVTNETAFSESGRGRLPSFLMEDKAFLLEKGDCSLNKAYLGSYKDYVPNYYRLGYWLVGKTKEKYGNGIWNRAISEAARRPFSLSPVNSVLKKETGLNLDRLYKQVFSELKGEWEQQIEEARPVDYPHVSPAKKVFTSYLYGRQYQGSYYTLRESLDDIPRIVRIDGKKKEQVLYSPGFLFKGSFSGEKKLLIWSENQPDIRWSHSDRSVIVVFDTETGKLKKFRTDNKVFAPKISPDLKYFAAVEIDVQNRHFLSVFDLETGQRLEKYSTPDNQLFFTPCWNEKSDRLFFIALNQNGKYLASWKVGEETHETLTRASFADVKNPFFDQDRIYFSGSFSGIDNIYAIDLEDKDKYQLTSVKFGADYPSVSDDGKEIIFSNYSSDGFALSRLDNQPSTWTWLNDFPEDKNELADNLSAQLKGELMLEKPDSLVYPSKSYSKLGHTFNIHSWAPLYIDTDEYEVRPGVSLFSQNKLGTSIFRAGYNYDYSEKTGKVITGFKYSGWFPVFDAEVGIGKRASEYYQINQTKNQSGQIISQDTVVKRFTWNEQDMTLNVSLPLTLSSGKYYRLLQPEMEYEYTNISHNVFFSGNYQTLSYRLYFHNLQRMSDQDIQYDWGQIVELVYRHSPFGKIDFGDLIAAHAYLYFPGLAKNHGLRIYNGYQEKTMKTQNAFSNTVRIPRGYFSVQNTRFYSFAGDYRFPVACPDLSIGKWAYIKRIKAALFYDYGNLQIPLFDDDGNYLDSAGGTMKSLGVELLSDLHVLRFIAPIELGVRSIYRPDYQDMQFELLASIDFSAF